MHVRVDKYCISCAFLCKQFLFPCLGCARARFQALLYHCFLGIRPCRLYDLGRKDIRSFSKAIDAGEVVFRWKRNVRFVCMVNQAVVKRE